MTIQDESVLQKMEAEIQKALQHKNQSGKVREHVRAVRLLADLLLDDQEDQAATQPSIPAMPTQTEPKGIQPLNTERLKDEDANGDSIFDF
ncbi:YwdI family protein [Radiobacillus kanasensis]|uniref:YwdI family protein n=1 Tax=Radiobacillus kanasensis TaxID=2844358 RepID=UPI001E3B056F|nr:YwdI family protein [Radiobacillus kanasensis]UFT99001.1 YwdI family protein [Radiobacillus kanasensis]